MTTVPLRQIRALAITLLEKAGATANDAGFIANIHLERPCKATMNGASPCFRRKSVPHSAVIWNEA